MKSLYLICWGALMLLGMPIAFSLGAICFAFFWIDGSAMTSVPQRMFAALDSFPLLAVPTFILAGEVMNSGGLTRRIVEFSRVLVGHIAGGLAHVTVLPNVIVSGISGSALAEAAGVGSVMIEAMKKQGFGAGFAGALNAAASTIGPLIPPSIPLVIYAVMTSQSAGKMLLAGFAPGFLVAIALMVYAYFVSRRRGYPVSERATWADLWRSTRSAFLALMTPVIIIWGIVGGVVTPTEAAVIAVLYALFLGTVVYRELTWKTIWAMFGEAAMTTATVMFIVAASALLAWVLTRQQAGPALVKLVTSVSTDPTVILLMLNVILLVLGCFLETLSLMLLLVPVLLPLIKTLGIDPVHFGVMFTLNLMIGLITPPVSMSMFITCRIARIQVAEFAREIWPFVIALVAVLLMVTYFPAIVLFLPNLVMGNWTCAHS